MRGCPDASSRGDRASPFRTRLAPSPTGSLHLGNARTFLITYWMARQARGHVVLRVEDIDQGRSRRRFMDQQIKDLRWLGLDWDEGPVLQSERLSLYERAFEQLKAAGAIYPCTCSRKEVLAAASAPHADDDTPTYPGTCRDRYRDEAQAAAERGRPPCWRFRVAEGVIAFDDRMLGPVESDPSKVGGDFVVRSTDGTFSYQLAVTVDDAAQLITEVVRGDDLVASTPRQILLYRALGHPVPRFTHLPLVVDEHGRRLSKRRGDLDLSKLRQRGVDAREVVDLIARQSGLANGDAARDGFDLGNVPREPVVLGRLPSSEDMNRSTP